MLSRACCKLSIRKCIPQSIIGTARDLPRHVALLKRSQFVIQATAVATTLETTVSCTTVTDKRLLGQWHVPNGQKELKQYVKKSAKLAQHVQAAASILWPNRSADPLVRAKHLLVSHLLKEPGLPLWKPETAIPVWQISLEPLA